MPRLRRFGPACGSGGCWQPEAHLGLESVAVEIVDHVQRPEAASVAELFVQEVHWPVLVFTLGHRQRPEAFPHEVLVRLDRQVELQFGIDPIAPLMIPALALCVVRGQRAKARAPPQLRERQADHPVGALRVLVAAFRRIPIAGLDDAERLAGRAHAEALLLHGSPYRLAPTGRTHDGFPNASSTVSALFRSSAYIFCNR